MSLKYRVLGARTLLKVKKYSEKKDNTYKGTSIVMPENVVETETTAQTIGEIVQHGEESKEIFTSLPKEGDIVHFQRYGAARLNLKLSDEFELWVINTKDLFVIEEEVNNE